MDIKIFPAVIRFVLRQKISAVFRNRRKKGLSCTKAFRPSLPDEGSVPLQGVLEQVAAVVSVRVVKIVIFLLPGLQTEIQKDERLILHVAGRKKAEAAELILSQNITLTCHFFILEAISGEYYNQDKKGMQPRRKLTGDPVKNIYPENGTPLFFGFNAVFRQPHERTVRAERRRK